MNWNANRERREALLLGHVGAGVLFLAGEVLFGARTSPGQFEPRTTVIIEGPQVQCLGEHALGLTLPNGQHLKVTGLDCSQR